MYMLFWVQHINKALQNSILSNVKKRARGLPSLVASQVVVVTTHGAIGDDKAVKSSILYLQ